jgi:hypothetical protein
MASHLQSNLLMFGEKHKSIQALIEPLQREFMTNVDYFLKSYWAFHTLGYLGSRYSFLVQNCNFSTGCKIEDQGP